MQLKLFLTALCSMAMAFCGARVSAQQTERITYYIDDKPKTVNAVYVGMHQYRFYLDDRGNIAVDIAWKPSDAGWENFKYGGIVYNRIQGMSNHGAFISGYMSAEIDFYNAEEDIEEGYTFVYIYVKRNKNDADFMWSDQKYAYVLQQVYRLVNSQSSAPQSSATPPPQSASSGSSASQLQSADIVIYAKDEVVEMLKHSSVLDIFINNIGLSDYLKSTNPNFWNSGWSSAAGYPDSTSRRFPLPRGRHILYVQGQGLDFLIKSNTIILDLDKQKVIILTVSRNYSSGLFGPKLNLVITKMD